MKTNKYFLALLMTLILVLAACQPQAAKSPEALPSDAPAASPEATNPPAATDAPQSQSAALFAKISELAGTVEIKQAAQSSFTPVSAEMQLEVDGQIQTGADGRVRLDLSSGTIIRIAPSSLFTLTSNEETEDGLLTTIKMELGNIFIILNGGRTEVETPAGVAAVQGSYLKIEFNPETGELTLTCLEGDCSIITPDGQTKSFTNGQKIKVHQDANGAWILDEGPMSPEDFQEWLENNPEAQDLVDQASGGGDSSGGNGGSGGGACLSLIQPSAGAGLGPQGQTTFEWGSQFGAANYVVKFTTANGNVISFETADTNIQPYIEGFLPQAGETSWSVTALDANGAEICTSESSTFSKPDSEWERENNDDDDYKKEPPAEPACGYYCTNW